MSWHYSQGEEAASWDHSSLAGAPSALLKLLPGGETACSNASGKATCPRSPSGMTLRRSTGGRGMASLMWFLADSPVRTYRPPDAAPESAANDRDCGPSSPGSLARYNPSKYGWKTRQCLLLGGLETFSETFPRWGMVRNGELFPLPTPSGLSLLRQVISLHLTTFANVSGSEESGLRVPTPKASPSGPDLARETRITVSGRKPGGDDLATFVARVPTPRSEDSHECAGGHRDQDDTLYGLICRQTTRVSTPTCPRAHDTDNTAGRYYPLKKKRSLESDVVQRLLPTPNKRDWKDCGPTQGNRHSPNLGTQVHRMPTAHGMSKDGLSNGPSGNELGRAVNRMPTPRAQEHCQHNSRDNGMALSAAVRIPTPTVACATGGQTSRSGDRKNELLLAGVAGGSLNPDWVEWLHGWPIGWTASAPLAMDRFQQWLLSHTGW